MREDSSIPFTNIKSIHYIEKNKTSPLTDINHYLNLENGYNSHRCSPFGKSRIVEKAHFTKSLNLSPFLNNLYKNFSCKENNKIQKNFKNCTKISPFQNKNINFQNVEQNNLCHLLGTRKDYSKKFLINQVNDLERQTQTEFFRKDKALNLFFQILDLKNEKFIHSRNLNINSLNNLGIDKRVIQMFFNLISKVHIGQLRLSEKRFLIHAQIIFDKLTLQEQNIFFSFLSNYIKKKKLPNSNSYMSYSYLLKQKIQEYEEINNEKTVLMN